VYLLLGIHGLQQDTRLTGVTLVSVYQCIVKAVVDCCSEPSDLVRDLGTDASSRVENQAIEALLNEDDEEAQLALAEESLARNGGETGDDEKGEDAMDDGGSGDDDEEVKTELLAPAEETNEEAVNIDFRFCDARPDCEDELFIRALLTNGFTGRLLGGEDADIRKLAQQISAQMEIGTFVKTDGNDDDDSIYAFVTVLDVKDSLPSSLLSKVAAALPDMKKKRVGWVVRERIVNVPEEVTGPLYSCLKDDLAYAEKEYKEGFDSFLIFAPCFRANVQDEAEERDEESQQKRAEVSESKSNKKKKKKADQPRDSDYEYAQSEDLLFSNLAGSKFRFDLKRPAPKEGVDEPESINYAPWSTQALVMDKQAFLQGVQSLGAL